jgi:hypothetical protein
MLADSTFALIAIKLITQQDGLFDSVARFLFGSEEDMEKRSSNVQVNLGVESSSDE